MLQFYAILYIVSLVLISLLHAMMNNENVRVLPTQRWHVHCLEISNHITTPVILILLFSIKVFHTFQQEPTACYLSLSNDHISLATCIKLPLAPLIEVSVSHLECQQRDLKLFKGSIKCYLYGRQTIMFNVDTL